MADPGTSKEALRLTAKLAEQLGEVEARAKVRAVALEKRLGKVEARAEAQAVCLGEIGAHLGEIQALLESSPKKSATGRLTEAEWLAQRRDLMKMNAAYRWPKKKQAKAIPKKKRRKKVPPR